MKDFDLLKKLTETPGVPGREERIRELIRAESQDLFDEFRTDAIGNLIAVRRPTRAGRGSAKPRRIMIACHIDEIGFYVKHIDEKGFLRLNPAGGFDTRNLFARKVLVQGRRDVIGVLNPAGRPIHIATDEEKKKVYKVGEFFVDLHLPPAQVTRLVRVGDPVTLIQTTEPVGKAIVGKCMDNRVATFVALGALRKIAKSGSPHEICYVGTVQEEVGLRGAGPATFGIEPDIAIAIDVTLACDTPGVPPEEAVCTFGGGAAIKVMDHASISDRELVDEFLALAEAKKIKHQLEILPLGGTDAAAMQRAMRGHRTITLSVPCRYVHTVTESVHTEDVKATIDLLAAYLQS
ncbi:MAG: M42 family metallopeptidase [Planctomycetes bacterium]|nr:M42 family metallopeptidase [Planctomycetota bacterium]